MARRAHSLPTVSPGSGTSIRLEVARHVARLADADAGLFYGLVRSPSGELVPVDVTATAYAREVHALLAGTASRSSALPDVTQAPAAETRHFLDACALFGSWEQFAERPFTQQVRAETGLGDQIRLLVFEGPRFVGWIGALRRWDTPSFGPVERRRLAPFVQAIRDALRTAYAADALDTPSDAAFIIARPDGSVSHASQTAVAWLGRPAFREALVATVRALDLSDGRPRPAPLERAHATFSRLEGDEGTRYMVVVERAEPVIRPLSALLSSAQRRVAEAVAAGATCAEVARSESMGKETVRTHLREAYRRLDVSTRLELARALRDQPA